MTSKKLNETTKKENVSHLKNKNKPMGNENQNIDPKWKGVIRWGGAALFLSAPIGILFFILVVASGQTLPVPVEVALEEPTVPQIVYTVAILGELLLLPGGLALYFALKDVKKAPMFFATALWVLCVPLFIASRGLVLATTMLSNSYLNSSDEATKAAYLVIAEFAIETQNIYAMFALIFLSIASIIIGVVMLKGKEVFGNKIGFVVIGAGIFTLIGALTLVLDIPVIVPVIGVILTITWQFVIGIKMFRLGKEVPQPNAA